MGRGYKFLNQSYPYFVTITIVEWIDLFTRPHYVEIVLDSLRYCMKHKGLIVYAWCIMPNHLHMIIGTRGNNMEDILRDFKKHTSITLKKAMHGNKESRRNWMVYRFIRAGTNNSNNIKWQLWQQHNHPIELSWDSIVYQNSITFI